MNRAELLEALTMERFTRHQPEPAPRQTAPPKAFEVMVYDPEECAERLRELAEDLGIDTWLAVDVA